MSDSNVEAALARIEAKLEAVAERLDEGAAELRDLRVTKTTVATQGQALRVHSKLFWGLGSGLLALACERLKALL